MVNDWPIVNLGDVAANITVGHVGPMASEYQPSGIPFLRSQDIKPYRLNLSGIAHISEGFHARLQKSALKPGDVVIVRTGKPGTAAVIPESLPIANCSDLVIVRPGKKLDSRFLVYYVNSLGNSHVASYLVGAVQQHFNVGSARQFKIALPNIDEQHAIGSALGDLDDKIGLNLRMNETLEAIGRAIFKSWFVDSATVRQLSTVGSEFNLTMGQSPPGETYNEAGEGLPFFQGRTDFGVRYPQARISCTTPTRLAEKGDTLVSVRAPVGDINMAKERCCIGRGVAALRHKSLSRSYTYYSAHSLKEQLTQFEAEGTVFGSIGKDQFKSLKIPAPPLELIHRFEKAAKPIDDLIEKNEEESLTLREVRDALLPKLLSGAIRLRQVATAPVSVQDLAHDRS